MTFTKVEAELLGVLLGNRLETLHTLKVLRPEADIQPAVDEIHGIADKIAIFTEENTQPPGAIIRVGSAWQGQTR